MSLINQIQADRVPQHVAVIMDGNGRWAKKQGKIRVKGHYEGVDSVRAVLEAASDIGVKYLTLYAFSMENWNRPRLEVESIMTLLIATLRKEVKNFMEKGVRFHAIGEHSYLPAKARKLLNECIEETKHNSRINLIIALSYGSRYEISSAAKKIAQDAAAGKLDPESINEENFGQYLYTAPYPDPELLIRTSGEYRISNYLLWQIAYAELYFTEKFWPEFRREDFFEAVVNYQGRERRFGKTSEQIGNK